MYNGDSWGLQLTVDPWPQYLFQCTNVNVFYIFYCPSLTLLKSSPSHIKSCGVEAICIHLLWHKYQNCDVKTFLYMHMTHWFTFTCLYIHTPNNYSPSDLVTIIYPLSNLISEIASIFRNNCICKMSPHCIWTIYPPLSLSVCVHVRFSVHAWFSLCICVETEQRGPVQIATWVFVQYHEVNSYVMSVCSFFFYHVFL